MRRLLLMMLFAFAGNAQGGAITSGSLDFSGTYASAYFSGPGFSDAISDSDASNFPSGEFVPFQPNLPEGVFGVGIGSHGIGSSLTYNGVLYVPFDERLPGFPTESSDYSVFLTSPLPTITGPGVYPVTFSVQMSFCLYGPTGPAFYCESDTGNAAGFFNATPSGDPSFVHQGGLTLNIVPVPEPSTQYYVGFVVCFGFLAAAIRRYGASGPSSASSK